MSISHFNIKSVKAVKSVKPVKVTLPAQEGLLIQIQEPSSEKKLTSRFGSGINGQRVPRASNFDAVALLLPVLETRSFAAKKMPKKVSKESQLPTAST